MVGACGGLRWCRRGLQLFCKPPLSSLYAVPHRISRAAKRECAKVVYSTMWTLCTPTFCISFVFAKGGIFPPPLSSCSEVWGVQQKLWYGVNCCWRLLAFKLLFTRPIKQIVGAIEREHIANAPHVNCSNYEPRVFNPVSVQRTILHK